MVQLDPGVPINIGAAYEDRQKLVRPALKKIARRKAVIPMRGPTKQMQRIALPKVRLHLSKI